MKTRVLILCAAMICLLGMLACSDNGEAKDKAAENDSTVATAKKGQPQEVQPVGVESDSLVGQRPTIRNKNNTIVTIATDFGNMTLELYRDVAPAHADSFVARTKDGFYNGLIFHRLVANFMIQGGDPQGDGTGNAGYFLPAEFSDLPHIEGTLSMARSRDINSASSQFFICLKRTRSTAGLDGKYTVFGHLLKGYETLHAIGELECTANPSNPREISKPTDDVVMRKVYLSDADGNPL
ncbi:MAG: peptidylprolyl isomerase [candidate division Zixibacteria bacterium]|nr:peptidylprolyl isomerase [candidate division Zixibacteria bacterium]